VQWAASEPAAAAVLARHLQAAVAHTEDLATVLHELPGRTQGSSPLDAALRLLVRPFRLRLVRGASHTAVTATADSVPDFFFFFLFAAPDESVLNAFPPMVISIEPLATGRSIESFLWPRVRADTSAAPGIFGRLHSDRCVTL
jgi:hypothetical protein